MDTKINRRTVIKKWLWTAAFLAVAAGLSAAKIIELPKQGGAATYFSLLFLWLVSYTFGFRHGLVCSVLFGVIRILINAATGESIAAELTLGEILAGPIGWKVWLALILEYPLAYGVFCLGALLRLRGHTGFTGDKYTGAWSAEAWELRLGYLIGAFGQFVFYVISAVCCYEPPAGEGFWGILLYHMTYDGFYLLIEAALTFILLCIPPVVEALDYLKYVATCPEEDEVLNCF